MIEHLAPAGGAEELVATGRADAALLVWGIKASFLRYVAGVGGGVSCDDGAVPLDDGFVFGGARGFGFPVVGADDGIVTTRGAVHIVAHGGLLDIGIRELHLSSGTSGDVLSIAGDGTSSRRTLATAPPSDLAAPETAPFRLDPDAVVLFDSTYPPGTELDPVRFFQPRTDTRWRRATPLVRR
jgi:hypothetical protein